jgi:hypothetical protein
MDSKSSVSPHGMGSCGLRQTGRFGLTGVEKVGGGLRMGGCGEDRALVLFQDFQ